MTKDNRYGIYFFIVMVGVIIALYFYKKKLRTLPQRYTIGIISRIGKSPSGGFFANYNYSIDGFEVSNTRSLDQFQGEVHEHERYIVAVPEGHKRKGLMLFECQIPDTLQAPEQGWTTPPKICRNALPKNLPL